MSKVNGKRFDDPQKALAYERLCEQVRTVTHYEGEPIAVFIVHEAPDNKCSERASIQNYFKNNGIECEEYQW